MTSAHQNLALQKQHMSYALKTKTFSNELQNSSSISYLTFRKKLVKISLETHETMCTDINLNFNISNRTSICKLPGNKFFCYGKLNDSNNPSGIAFTIDDSYKVKYLKSGLPCSQASLSYFDGCVYVFGGLNPKASNICARYDVERNKWNPLRSLEKPCRLVCSVAVGTVILYSGSEMDTYLFDSWVNSHYRVLRHNNSFRTIIFEGNSRGYVIELKGIIYESNYENLFTWTSIGSTNFQCYWILGFRARYNENIYFLLYQDLFKFDLKNKKMEEVSHIDYEARE